MSDKDVEVSVENTKVVVLCPRCRMPAGSLPFAAAYQPDLKELAAKVIQEHQGKCTPK